MLTLIENFFKIVCLLIVILSSHKASAQDNDDGLTRRNTIKYHFISTALYVDESFVLSYERITKPNQSFAIMTGFVKFPLSANLGSIVNVTSDGTKNGFTFGGEYRFYLKKENKYPAPHGVFIGPYVNTYRFGNDRTLTITPPDGSPPNEVSLTSNISVINIGFQMGYQFVLNNRWTIDMVFIGPSLSRYHLKARLDGDFSKDEEDLIGNELLLGLLDRFPLLKELLDDEEIDLHGNNNKWAPGFRYQLNLGYRFGGGKK